MGSIDSGSDSTVLNGLNDGSFNDIYCDDIEVGQNAIVNGNLTVGGNQIFAGSTIFANTVQFNGAVYGLTGGTGISYDPLSRTITNIAGDYWSATGSDDIVNKAGKIVNITRESSSSKIVLNYGATGSSNVGIYYNDNNNTGVDYPLITSGATPDEVLFGTPNNQDFGGYVSLKPKQLTVPTLTKNLIILQKPAGSIQTVESDFDIIGNLDVSGAIYGLTGGVGINYEPVTGTITNTFGDYWSATGSNDIVNKAGKIVNITRESSTSKIVLNYGATGATRVGIFYNDNNNTVVDYPLITTGTTPDEVLFGTPNNQDFGGYMALRPKQLTSPLLTRNLIILQSPAGSSQTVESDFNVQGALRVNANDYKSYFSSSGFAGLSYNGTGNYNLDISSINQSKWDISGNTIYPKTATQILIGQTGPADAFSAIHIKSSTTPSLLVESISGSFTPSVRFKNQTGLFGSISQDFSSDRIDVNLNSVSNVASFLPNKVGINKINPDFQLEVKNESSSSSSVITSHSDNSGGYAGSFLRNNAGLPLVIFANGSSRTSEGGPNVATIRNDLGEKIRLQNNYEFGFGPEEVILGDPQAVPTIQGNASNSAMQFQSTIFKDNYIYFAGYINSSASTIIKNFNGANSAFSIPSTGSIRRAMILQYTTSGIVNNVWVLPANVSSEIKMMYAGSNKIYVCGLYSSTVNSTLNNLNGTASIYTLPLTNAVSGYYAGWCVGFDSITFELNRFITIYGANNSRPTDNFISSIAEDAFGNVFVAGTIVSNNNASIRNFLNVATGLTLNLTNAQNGFIIRFDLNGNYTGHWGWNFSTYACFVNDMAICPALDRLYVAMSVYNLGVSLAIDNWNGGGTSAYSIPASSGYSSAHWTALLIRFAGVSTIGSPVATGRQAFSNDNLTSYIPYPLSSVCYSSIHDKIYWSSPVSNTAQIAFFNAMTDVNYSQVLSPPQGDANTGVMTFIQYNDVGSGIYGFPGSIWGYQSIYSGIDGIYRMRENPNNGYVYLQGSIRTDNQPVFRGFFEANSRLQFPPNISFGTSYYQAFSIVINLNIVLGISSIPYSSGWSYCSDICFPTSSRLITAWTMSNNNNGPVIRNYDQYNSAYSIPVISINTSGVIVDYTTRKTVSTSFTSKGIGIGRTNQSIAELEVEKGIMTPSFVQCSEIRVNDYSLPLKFTDVIGREVGSLCRAWACLDGVRAFQPVIKASMNIRYVDKTANGKYRVFFSQYAPHDRFATFVSSTGYNSGNYTVFPFIDTNVAPGFPAFKFVYGIGITVNNQGGVGFDLQEVNVACFW